MVLPEQNWRENLYTSALFLLPAPEHGKKATFFPPPGQHGAWSGKN